MLPRFSLPPVEPGSAFNLATKPKQVDAWLTRLPYANPLEAAAELTDYLATCARLRLSPDTLEEILDCVMPTAGNLVVALKEKFHSESLPLPPNRQQAAELCSRLMLEVGHVCKLIILSRSGKRFQLFGAKSVERHAYILMLALKEVVEVSLDTHQSPPAGIWKDIHQAYNFALINGWARALPPGFSEGPSLEDVYKYALLLDLADPYRIPREELFATKDIVLKFCGLVDLLAASDANLHGSVFAIDQESDSPAIVLSREAGADSSRWQRLLNTTQLVKRLSLLASQYARDNKPGSSRLDGAGADLAYLELLHRLKAQWGGSVRRLGNRHPRYEATRFEVVFGLQSVHKRLEIPEAGLATSPFEVDAVPTTCLLVNDSVGGLALSRERPVSFQLHIGELAAVRQDRAERWSIGIVRWFRATRTGKAIFGLQYLAPSAAAVRLQREDDGAPLPALWLPATPSLRQGEMVLCQGGKLAVGANVTLLGESFVERRIRLEQLAEFTPAIEAYRYRTL